MIGLPGRRTRVAPLGRPERRLVRAASRSGADKPRPSGVEWRHRRPGSDFVDGVAAVSQRIRESNGTAFGRRVLSRRQVPATGIWARRAKGASPRLAASGVTPAHDERRGVTHLGEIAEGQDNGNRQSLSGCRHRHVKRSSDRELSGHLNHEDSKSLCEMEFQPSGDLRKHAIKQTKQTESSAHKLSWT